ncbi:MAG: bifunctional (p)ppGpp synthetase/guanosine-3',5'-bis(diphosphate) 3'-pyrophosphohydrolase [Vampirovibrionales bacterium]|nr:bifunctional (p)ppGpp synthetase/guanosine-3',5'-bis(diphosphate) 3'-pyrophosphohydrolase [Vampirovibrionales bacterium]
MTDPQTSLQAHQASGTLPIEEDAIHKPPLAAPMVLREDELFAALTVTLKKYGYTLEQLLWMEGVFTYARQKHDGQKRKNDENYITHPVSVAQIVADLTSDASAIAAAILHDTIEDTDATAEEIKNKFGDDVLAIVEGVTKLGKFEFNSPSDRQAENFRRMFLAMASDIRVILVKLCDRLHNMRTLYHLKPEKQQRIASETLDVFAPLANRLGIGKIRSELEDLSLKYLEPDAYKHIDDNFAETLELREKTISFFLDKVGEQLQAIGITPNIYGRVKNHYSIFRKMRSQQKELEDIYDITAVRVVVPDERDCYSVLGIVHNTFSPVPGRFKDYIAMPKSNLYRSLHTTVLGPMAKPLEVQIRTQEMHQIAEYGIAAHWKYKAGEGPVTGKSTKEEDTEHTFAWLRQMLAMNNEAEDASDYVQRVKLDLFQDEVFAFTPKGQVVDLPKGSSVVDFAYRIHTEVGHSCSGVKVNGKIVPLSHLLKNGDIVEVIRRKNAQPRLDWLKFAKTQAAKAKIRQWFKRNKQEEHQANGKRMLEEALTRAGYEEIIQGGQLLDLAKEFNYDCVDDLLVALGYGELNLTRVTNRLNKVRSVANQEDALQHIRRYQKERYKDTTGKHCPIPALKGMLYHLARCCTPVPGEDIEGVVTRSRGVMVHRADCQNLNHVNPERRMELYWSEGSTVQHESHTVRLEVLVIDRVGVLKDILGRIADTHTNVSNIRVKMQTDGTAILELTVDVSNAQHVERVKAAIQRLPDVVAIKRQQFRVGHGDNE